ncbi:MAG: tetratricopeptide repeat protein [Spirochaetaceae bacterium]|jgi:tetratricopeptide (TPR) repeat protein|nr:tetratricopeptide repeat protein [Spirochaetaceae bacterium]
MDTLIPILVAIALLVGIVAMFIVIRSRSQKAKKEPTGAAVTPEKKSSKDQKNRIKDAYKKLSQNPRDPNALLVLGDSYFTHEAWGEAYKVYEILVELVEQGNRTLNEFLIYQRCGLSALELSFEDNAYKALQIARTLRQDNLEVNYNLGVLEFKKNNYEKAISLFQSARAIDREYTPALRYLGHSLFKIKKYKEAMAFILKAIELAPTDKESLYVLGECYYEANQTDQALKIFTHLRNDPAIGANACYFSGIINFNNNKFDKAAEDFELGIKYQEISSEIKSEMKYKLADAYIKVNNIAKAVVVLKNLQSETPGYRDVPALITKYQELNTNKNLQIFLFASAADFVNLCRRVVSCYFSRARVKITDVSLNKNEWADVLAEIDTPQWSELVMFRFIRTSGAIGEIIIRDFHAHIKDANAGKGICITVGSYSDEAKHFTEARLIDLIGKEQFLRILKSMDSQLANAGKKK